MADVFTPAKRSAVMAGIRSRNNRSTELALMCAMRAAGVSGWRRHVAIRLPQRVHDRDGPSRPRTVRPDFVFRESRVVVFVDGCFWHGCPKHCTKPATNAAWWREKLHANAERDRETTRLLTRAGWRVLRLWEHALSANAEACAGRIRRLISATAGSPAGVASAQSRRRKRRDCST